MKQRHHATEQVIGKLAEGDRLLNEGQDLAEVLTRTACSSFRVGVGAFAPKPFELWCSDAGGEKASNFGSCDLTVGRF